MTIREVIQQLESAAARMGDDAEFELYDHSASATFRVKPDVDVFDYEILYGDHEVVVEFDGGHGL